jgi:hypothetical protein
LTKRPAPPKNPNAIGKDQEVMLSWEAPELDGENVVTGYAVYRASLDGTAVLVAEINATGQSDMCYVIGIPISPQSSGTSIGSQLTGASGLVLVTIIAAVLASIALISRRARPNASRTEDEL